MYSGRTVKVKDIEDEEMYMYGDQSLMKEPLHSGVRATEALVRRQS